VDALGELSWDALSPRQLLSVLARLERTVRRLPVTSQLIITRLDREATAEDLGGSGLAHALAEQLRISRGEARRRIGDAAALAPRVGLTGEVLEPLLPATAAAQVGGDIGREQLAIIRDVIDHIPHDTSPDAVRDVEAQMANYGTGFRPEQLRTIGRRILDTINPDGDLDERERARRRGISMGPQGADGMSRLSGWITPELRASLEPGLHKLAAPGMCNPDDDRPCTSGTPSEDQIKTDGRSGAQRNHDALLAICRGILSSGQLGQHHGIPVTIVVSASLQDLETGSGHALTAGGTLLPMSEVIRLAADAFHYLYIYDNATDQPMNLFRTKRCASEAQRIALQAIHGGCTHPGCTAPAYLTEVHHLDEFADGGNTNVEDLTLACRPHHKLVKPGGWQTRRGEDGRTVWIPPPELDSGQARTNDFHHPERLLGKAS
jgi:hypothetical protein